MRQATMMPAPSLRRRIEGNRARFGTAEDSRPLGASSRRAGPQFAKLMDGIDSASDPQVGASRNGGGDELLGLGASLRQLASLREQRRDCRRQSAARPM